MKDKDKSMIDPKDLALLLRSGAANYRCGMYLYHMPTIDRQQIYQELEIERLQRKYLEIREIYNYTGQDWNKTFLVSFLKYLSDEANRANYAELGMRLNYNMILRERGSLRNLEALLVAVSGLVDTLPRDSFTNTFRKDVEYMKHKYMITSLRQDQWQRRRMTPVKEPILRLIQVARLLYDNDMIFNKLVNCRSRNDVFNLFNVESGSEWSRYFGDAKVRRIGAEKCDLIGINFVVPMLYAFGHYTSSDEITQQANDLNESLPAESNRYIKGWRREGLTPMIAYETQALLQLFTKYCHERCCEGCYLYKHMLSKRSVLSDIPAFLEYQR